MQQLTLTVKFKVEQKPDTEFHLKNLITLNNHYIRGEDIVEEDGKLVYYK